MRVLIIAAGSFAPSNVIGAIRWTKIAKYLSKRGNSVTIIAENTYVKVKDEILAMDAIVCNKVIYVKESRLQKIIKYIYFSVGKLRGLSVRECYDNLWTAVHMNKYIRLLSYFGFLSEAKKVISELSDSFDVVISTNPLSAHWTARYTSIKTKKPWIADFRDPLASASQKTIYGKWMKGWQNRICDDADAIIAVSNGLKEVISHGEQKILEKTSVIYNGYDPDDRPEDNLNESNNLRFVYTGILYTGKRDLSPMFQALRELINESKILENEITFDYAGNEFDILKQQAAKFGMEGILVDHGFISRKESLDLQASADILTMATYNDPGNPGVMPGKLYEYMMLKKPILAVVSGTVQGSELQRVINETDSGYCHESSFSDLTTLKSFISVVAERKKMHKDAGFSFDVVRFEYPNIAKQVYQVINETMDRHGINR